MLLPGMGKIISAVGVHGVVVQDCGVCAIDSADMHDAQIGLAPYPCRPQGYFLVRLAPSAAFQLQHSQNRAHLLVLLCRPRQSLLHET